MASSQFSTGVSARRDIENARTRTTVVRLEQRLADGSPNHVRAPVAPKASLLQPHGSITRTMIRCGACPQAA